MGENIGAAARAMMNFGLSDLRIVAPRDGWPNAKAHEMAARADTIIENATIFSTLPEALYDCHYALSTSARTRTQPLSYLTPRQAAMEALAHPGRTAFVFGQENNGLSNEDLAYCHAIITIPAAPINTSLNLAQCVNIVAYEWYNTQLTAPTLPPDVHEHATIGEAEALVSRLETLLATRDYFTQSHKPVQQQMLRRLIVENAFSSKDIKALHGIVKALASAERKSS